MVRYAHSNRTLMHNIDHLSTMFHLVFHPVPTDNLIHGFLFLCAPKLCVQQQNIACNGVQDNKNLSIRICNMKKDFFVHNFLHAGYKHVHKWISLEIFLIWQEFFTLTKLPPDNCRLSQSILQDNTNYRWIETLMKLLLQLGELRQHNSLVLICLTLHRSAIHPFRHTSQLCSQEWISISPTKSPQISSALLS